MFPETHEKYQITATRTIMYIVVEILDSFYIWNISFAAKYEALSAFKIFVNIEILKFLEKNSFKKKKKIKKIKKANKENKFWQTQSGYEKQNNFIFGSLKIKLRICREPEVLLSSFDSYVVSDIIVLLPIFSFIHALSGYKMKCDHGVFAGVFHENSSRYEQLKCWKNSFFQIFANFLLVKCSKGLQIDKSLRADSLLPKKLVFVSFSLKLLKMMKNALYFILKPLSHDI